MLTGESFSAKTAQELGLIHKIVIKKNLSPTTQEFLKIFAANAPFAAEKTKKLLTLLKEHNNPKEIQDYTADVMASVRASSIGQEGLNAFLENRLPKWNR